MTRHLGRPRKKPTATYEHLDRFGSLSGVRVLITVRGNPGQSEGPISADPQPTGAVERSPQRALESYSARRPLAALAFGAALLSHWPFRRLDLDLHHDGYMAAVAVAVAEGRTPHSEVFTQYGPLIAYLQGFWLRFTGISVLNLRTLHILLFAATAAILALSGRTRYGSPWPIHPMSGPIAAFSWIVLSDTFTGVPIFPWVSMLVALTMVTTLNLVRLGREADTPRLSRWLSTTAGTVAATILLSRPSLFLVLAVGVLLGFIDPAFRDAQRRFIIGLAAGASMIAGILAVSPFRTEFVIDMFSWPFTAYAGGGALRTSVTVLGVTGFNLLPQIGAVLLVTLRMRRTVSHRDFSWALLLLTAAELPQLQHLWWQIAFLVGLLVIIAIESRFFADKVEGLSHWSIILLLGAVVVGAPLITGYWPGWHAFVGERSAISIVSITGLYTTAFVAGILAATYLIAAMLDRGLKDDSRTGALLASFVLAGLAETAAAPDTRHIWWGLPVGLLLLVHHGLCESRLLGVWFRRMVPIGFVIAGAGALLMSLNYAGEPRVELHEGIGRGMRVSQHVAEEYMSQLDLVGQLPADVPVLFEVRDALITVIGGSFLPQDRHIVSWGPARADGPTAGLSEIVEIIDGHEGRDSGDGVDGVKSRTGRHSLVRH